MIDREPVSAYRLALNLGMPYETARRHVARLVNSGKPIVTGAFTPRGSALMIACGFKREATARQLVEAEADLNLVSDSGHTALDRANEEGLEELAAEVAARHAAAHGEGREVDDEGLLVQPVGHPQRRRREGLEHPGLGVG